MTGNSRVPIPHGTCALAERDPTQLPPTKRPMNKAAGAFR